MKLLDRFITTDLIRERYITSANIRSVLEPI